MLIMHPAIYWGWVGLRPPARHPALPGLSSDAHHPPGRAGVAANDALLAYKPVLPLAACPDGGAVFEARGLPAGACVRSHAPPCGSAGAAAAGRAVV